MTAFEPLISVIIPIYNVEKYLNVCLDSILNQTYKKIEIILVDDGSTDSSLSICHEYKKADERIKIISKSNGGLSSARNAGLDVALGDYISFLDSDDWLEFNTYSLLVDIISKTRHDIIAYNFRKIDDNYIVSEINSYSDCLLQSSSGKDIAKKILTDELGSQACFALYARKLWNDIRFPLGRFYEDIPTTYKVYWKADKVLFINDVLYNYRINLGSISHRSNPIKCYHLYLGFLDHYLFALEYCAEIKEKILAETASFGISTIFHYYTDAQGVLAPYVDEVKTFLRNNKAGIAYSNMAKSRCFALRVFYFSEALFTFLCRILMMIGLQSKLGLEVK